MGMDNGVGIAKVVGGCGWRGKRKENGDNCNSINNKYNLSFKKVNTM